MPTIEEKLDFILVQLAQLQQDVTALKKPSIEPPPVPADSVWETLRLDDPPAEVIETPYGWVTKNVQMAQYDHDETIWRAWRGESPDSRVLDHGLSLERSRKFVLDWYDSRTEKAWDEVAAVEMLLGIRKTVESPLMSPKPQPHKTLEAWWDNYFQATRGGMPGVVGV